MPSARPPKAKPQTGSAPKLETETKTLGKEGNNKTKKVLLAKEQVPSHKAPPKKPTPKTSTKPTPHEAEPHKSPQPQPDIPKDGPASAFNPDALKNLEDLSLNLAKAAMTAQSALAQTLFKPHDVTENVPSDPFQVGPAMTTVANALASNPDKLVNAQTELMTGYLQLWAAMTRRSLGADDNTEMPSAKIKDKRFSDPRWEQNVIFDMMRQSYLLSSNWLNNLISSVEGIDPISKRRAEFFTKLVTDAFSPSNFLMSNPAALDTLMSTNGESLVKGMQKFAEDLARGDGKLKISQADYAHFEVGKNVATTPGKVIYRNAFFELLQYTPTTENVREIPLLIFPPWINKFYILDLQPKNSLIKWLTDQGFSVFVTSWVNPDASMKDVTFEDYLTQGIYEATKQVMAQCGTKTVNAVGYCIGGTLLGTALAHMAAKGDKSIGSATFFTAQHDFSEAGDLLLFTNNAWIDELERQMDAAGGVLPGAAMADTFNALRANDLVWSFFVNNYLMGKDLTAFDLLCWNADQTRMPKALHMFYLRKFYNENALSKGELELGGIKIDLKNVKIPVFTQAGREDHIAPPLSVFKGAKMFGGDVTYVLAGSGHIAGVVNPPAAQKYMHWINKNLSAAASYDDWFSKASEHAGSWWPYWAEWLHAKSGDWVETRDPSKGPLKPIMDAPGSYVMVKS